MEITGFINIIVFAICFYCLIKHTLGFIYFCIVGFFIYLLKDFLLTSTTAIIASIVGLIFFTVFIWVIYKIRKDENPEKVDETFLIVYGLTRENIHNFIVESLKVLEHQYLITELVIDEKSLETINRINIKCYKGRREVNILNIIFENEKAFIRSVNKVIDISRLIYCLKFENDSFLADLSKSQQIYSNTRL